MYGGGAIDLPQLRVGGETLTLTLALTLALARTLTLAGVIRKRYTDRLRHVKFMVYTAAI